MERSVEPFRYDPQPQTVRVQSRGTTTQRGYGHRHQVIRRLTLQRDPVCKRCNRLPSTISDHIHPILDGGDPWSLSNRQGLCRSCHDQKTKEDLAKRKCRAK
jgi:5-methylcytosine-specific restriction protein A